jgi:transcriptional regulator with XRE-family HTH domain
VASNCRYLRLTYERKRQNWSQSYVADRVRELGGSARLSRQSGISLVELGRLIPTEEELQTLGRVFGVSPAFFLLKPLVLEDRDARLASEESA